MYDFVLKPYPVFMLLLDIYHFYKGIPDDCLTFSQHSLQAPCQMFLGQ